MNYTPRQVEIIRAIRRSRKECGYAPSVRELCSELGGVDVKTMAEHLDRLEEKGAISRERGARRSLRVIDQEMAASAGVFSIPEVGRIAAGTPLLAEENIEGMVKVDRLFLRSPKGARHFILKVVGDSMIGAGILDGDRVIVRQQNTAENGEIVAALIDGEATVKRFYREKRRVRLQPENKKMKPIYAKEVEIQGVVVGVLRTFG